MSNETVDADDICANQCGAACCEGGAYLRPEDDTQLRAAGHGGAIREGDSPPVTRTDERGMCVRLDEDNRCEAYGDRPLDCRLFPLGFELDDNREVVHIVLVGCPLSDAFPDTTVESCVEDVEAALERFSSTSIRAYDELPFTADYQRIATVPYDKFEVTL